MDYEKLFKPYTRDGHTLKASIAYLKKIAIINKIPNEVVIETIQDIFYQVSTGKKFPLNKCPCGCGIDKAGTAITHAMRDRMFEIVYDKTKLYYQTINNLQIEKLDLEGDLFDLLNLIYEKIDAQKDRKLRQIQFKQNKFILRHPIKIGKLKIIFSWNKLKHWLELK